MMKNKRTYEERGWNDTLDLPLYLRRGLSGIFIMHKFPGEDKSHPTAIEDCPACVVRGWINRERDEQFSRNCLAHITECYEALFNTLEDTEKETIISAFDKRGDKPEITDDSTESDVIEAVVWYCHIITLIADVFGVCCPESEAELAYKERTERRKSNRNE